MNRMRFSTSISMMFREHPVDERFAAAGQAGFDGVEIQFLAEGDPVRMAAAAAAAGVEVVLINVGMGDYLVGGPGLSGVPGREGVFAEELDKALEAARLMQAHFVHVGPSRIPDGVAREACLDTFRANLDAALALHAARGSRAGLLVEPMNRVEAPTALVNDIDDLSSCHVVVETPIERRGCSIAKRIIVPSAAKRILGRAVKCKDTVG